MYNSRVPFETYGRFFPGYVQRSGTTNRAGRRRVLCFVTQHGTVGASINFSRAEAFNNATRAEHGLLDYQLGRDCADTLRMALSTRGYPVHSTYDELDDQSAACLEMELTERERLVKQRHAA